MSSSVTMPLGPPAMAKGPDPHPDIRSGRNCGAERRMRCDGQVLPVSAVDASEGFIAQRLSRFGLLVQMVEHPVVLVVGVFSGHPVSTRMGQPVLVGALLDVASVQRYEFGGSGLFGWASSSGEDRLFQSRDGGAGGVAATTDVGEFSAIENGTSRSSTEIACGSVSKRRSMSLFGNLFRVEPRGQCVALRETAHRRVATTEQRREVRQAAVRRPWLASAGRRRRRRRRTGHRGAPPAESSRGNNDAPIARLGEVAPAPECLGQKRQRLVDSVEDRLLGPCRAVGVLLGAGRAGIGGIHPVRSPEHGISASTREWLTNGRPHAGTVAASH